MERIFLESEFLFPYNRRRTIEVIKKYIETQGQEDRRKSQYPNAEQKVLFAKTFGCIRFIYNHMLSDKIKHYEETKQKLNNTPAQYKAEFE